MAGAAPRAWVTNNLAGTVSVVDTASEHGRRHRAGRARSRRRDRPWGHRACLRRQHERRERLRRGHGDQHADHHGAGGEPPRRHRRGPRRDGRLRHQLQLEPRLGHRHGDQRRRRQHPGRETTRAASPCTRAGRSSTWPTASPAPCRSSTPRSGAVVDTIPVGTQPEGLALDPVGRLALRGQQRERHRVDHRHGPRRRRGDGAGRRPPLGDRGTSGRLAHLRAQPERNGLGHRWRRRTPWWRPSPSGRARRSASRGSGSSRAAAALRRAAGRERRGDRRHRHRHRHRERGGGARAARLRCLHRALRRRRRLQRREPRARTTPATPTTGRLRAHRQHGALQRRERVHDRRRLCGGDVRGRRAGRLQRRQPVHDRQLRPGDGRCGHANNTAPCDDGNACTTGDACQGGSCVGRAAPSCNDGNACTDDACNPATGCVHANNTAPCDDGNACTDRRRLPGGACVGGARARAATTGTRAPTTRCTPATGCVHTNNTAPCNDGNACTTGDVCQGGQLRRRRRAQLQRRQPVHRRRLQPGHRLRPRQQHGAVQRRQRVHDWRRLPGRHCVRAAPLDCNDGNPCTDDICDSTLGCLHANNSLPCSDGNTCTSGDVCNGGTCVGGNTTAGMHRLPGRGHIPAAGRHLRRHDDRHGDASPAPARRATSRPSASTAGCRPPRAPRSISTCGDGHDLRHRRLPAQRRLRDRAPRLACNDDTPGCAVTDGDAERRPPRLRGSRRR